MKPPRTPLIVLALLVIACADGEDRKAPRTTARYDGSGRLVEGRFADAARPDVVLVCLDTVRADAVESGAAAAPAMPELAAFCARNTRFIDASAPSAWTVPSITSLLTGLSPEHHGCHGPGTSRPIVESIATLAEYLSAAGYATAAFSGGGWISPEMGFAQGFGTFTRYDAITLDDGGATLSKWVASIDRAKPYFLFVHSYEAHDPYGRKRPPAGTEDPAFVAQVSTYLRALRPLLSEEPSTSVPEGLDAAELLLRWRTEPMTYFGMTVPPGRMAVDKLVSRYSQTGFATDVRRAEIERKLRSSYLSGLARVDGGFHALMGKLPSVTRSTPPIVILTSDHGEAFGEQGIVGHGRGLMDVLTRVLLAVRAPGRLPVGAVHGSSTLADVVPTILELCGLPGPEGIDGVSLVPLARGEAPGHPVEADEYRDRYEGDQAVAMRVVSVRDERSKLVVTIDLRDGSVAEVLFDLVADPSELHPLPAADLAPLGETFVAAVERARARVARIAKAR